MLLQDRTPPPKTGGPMAAPDNRILIVFVPVKINEIFDLGRKYPWPKRASCPRCNHSRMWLHDPTAAKEVFSQV